MVAEHDDVIPFSITAEMLEAGRKATDELLDASEFQGGGDSREWLLTLAFMAMLRAIPSHKLEGQIRAYLHNPDCK